MKRTQTVYNAAGIRQLLKVMCEYCEDHGIVTVKDFQRQLEYLLSIADNN